MDEKLQIAGKIDQAIDLMMAAMTKVKQADGSNVKLPKAELDLLAQIETVRDIIMDVLKNQCDRTLLRDIFVGNDARLVRIRTMCKDLEFSAMNQGDQRLPTCLRACESVEKVLVDLGEGEALRKAEALIRDSGDLNGWLQAASTDLAEVANDEAPAVRHSRRKESDPSIATSSRIMSLVEADAERREGRLGNRLATLEVQFSEHLEGSRENVERSIANLEMKLAKIEAQLRELSAEAQLVDMVAEFGQVRVEIDQRAIVLTRRLEKVESHTTDIQNQATGATQQVSSLAETMDRHAADMKQRCTDITACLSEKLDNAVGDMKKRCADITSAHVQDWQALDTAHNRLESRAAGMEKQLTTLADVDRQLQKGLAGAQHEMLERAGQAGEQIKLLQQSVRESCIQELPKLQQSITEAYMQEIDKLRTATNLDPLWQSFAHVGSMVNKLQHRIDDMETRTEREHWPVDPRKPGKHRSHSMGAPESPKRDRSLNCRNERTASDHYRNCGAGAAVLF